MADVQRGGTSSPDWWAEAPAVRPADTYTDETGATALEFLAESLLALRDATNLTDYTLADAVRYLTEHVKAQDLVDTVAMIQDLKRTLGIAESFVARELGHLTQAEAQQAKTGLTSDGRPYEIKRGSIRKAWDHDGWKAQVRRAVIVAADAGGAVNPSTGEEVDLYGLLASAQEVHGSTAPKVKALKALGVDPDDYCESSPGPYAVSIQQNSPSPTTTTTTGA